jgi:hypothetical protein
MNSSSIIPYSFIGITTIILGYYTFFEKDIETADKTPLPESQSIMQSIIPEQEQHGGKHKKTQKHKKNKK